MVEHNIFRLSTDVQWIFSSLTRRKTLRRGIGLVLELGLVLFQDLAHEIGHISFSRIAQSLISEG